MPALTDPATATDPLTVAQVAAEFGVDETTVRRWIRAGLLNATRSKPLRGDYRITRAAVEQFKQETQTQN